jgi:hypothetical protein
MLEQLGKQLTPEFAATAASSQLVSAALPLNCLSESTERLCMQSFKISCKHKAGLSGAATHPCVIGDKPAQQTQNTQYSAG